MVKISLHWYYYFVGCILGGIILGFIFSSYYDRELLVQAGPPIEQIVEPSVLPPAIPSPSPGSLVTILFTGDVMLGRSVNKSIEVNQDPSWPFIYVKDVLSAADITYINLESPLTYGCPVADTGMVFCGDIGNVAGLKSAGVDVASVANNHALNYGAEGLDSTVSILSSNNIMPVGLGKAVTLPRGRTNYVFLSYNDIGRYGGIAGADLPSIVSQIKEAKSADNVLIVTFHWGSEYRAVPNNRQIELAHAAVDAGADLVIGAHPHWVQTKEIYMGKPIYYSLGNFVFDQEWSTETKRGLAVSFTYRGTELVSTDELPVSIQNYGQAHWQ